ncbi:cytochrome c [Brevundimonas subvibrioides]|uniref:Cytochrome c class II n=1 Tax=Brevundimonas subvibrioides (strain ATCC 15264 / DSM 4735 / LMG 14903 / NBRC 16000 / CB 81) TaxID=633149 RepID=D9QHQ5_BRESC|nr:cytochrome c [Brevundimonas subvibrioides]ADK99330.1 cytochrome c class II [Brevundimonas subvibrioides ATCC 15264]
MKRTIVMGVVALMCVAGVAGAQGQTSPGPSEIVAARQAAFAMSAAAFGSIRTGLDSGAPAQGLAFTAGGLNRWATALPTMFPAGTGSDSLPGATKAKAGIWTNRADFEAKAAAYKAATADLQAKIAANDTPGALEAWTAVRGTCGSCHDAYRE